MLSPRSLTGERCDVRMLVSALEARHSDAVATPLPPLLLCTVPMTPACEMRVFIPRQGEGEPIRLKSLYPRRVAGTGPVEVVVVMLALVVRNGHVQLRMSTSYLPEGHVYSVVFTSQWDSGQTFTADCAVNTGRALVAAAASVVVMRGFLLRPYGSSPDGALRAPSYCMVPIR